MHATFFGIKRVHLRLLAVTRRLVEPCGLTPARFDLLRIVLLQPDGIAQSTLQWLLGVAAPTVSRMLTSLEKLGFVERSRDYDDRRCRVVRLTDDGRAAACAARAITVESREADRTAARGVLGRLDATSDTGRAVEDTIAAGTERLGVLDSLIANMRSTFADRAPFPHPWRTPPFVTTAFITFVDGRVRYGDIDLLDALSS